MLLLLLLLQVILTEAVPAVDTNPTGCGEVWRNEEISDRVLIGPQNPIWGSLHI